MGMEKQGSKRGNYVGTFLQLFDWNTKSGKKLFPEKSKQKKMCDGNLPMTRIQMMMDVDEFVTGSSTKASSNYSCASSVTDEDHLYGSKVPGVVARLMGLDSLPKMNSCESYPIPLSDSQSLPGSYYRSEYCQDSQIMRSRGLHDLSSMNGTEPKNQKVTHRPPDKFQTEILPPKSAKAIPVTRNKLLSPIKSATVIPSEDAAHIMEAAARIIMPGPQTSARTKLPLSGSSLVPLKVRDLKEKVQATQKPAKVSEGSQRSGKSSAVKHLRRQSINKSWSSPGNASSLRIVQDSQEHSSSVKSKGKSISLALQAKENVLRREGLNLNGSRGIVSQNEMSEISANQATKNQSVAQKSVLRKSPMPDSLVLQPNNQKQNSNVHKGKLSSKSKVQNRKVCSEDTSSLKQRNSSKLVGMHKVSSRKLVSEVKDDRRQLMPSGSGRATSKKRAINGNHYSGKNHAVDDTREDKNEKVVHSSNGMELPTKWDQESGKMGAEVVSFTFTAPIARSGLGSGRYKEAGENCKILSEVGDDTLNVLLEDRLKELNIKVELSELKSETGLLSSTVPSLSALMSSTAQEENKNKCQDLLGGLQGTNAFSFRDPKLFMDDQKCQLSVLEHSTSLTSGCSYSDTVDSSIRGGKQCSSMQWQDSLSEYSISSSIPFEQDSELSDSASSNLPQVKWELKYDHISSSSSLPEATCELEYVKEMLCNIEVMFKNYTLNRSSEIINPHLFNQLVATKKNTLNRRLLFDCVSECMKLRFQQYAGGGYRLWSKGMRLINRKDKLAEDVCKEICTWRGMGDNMVDELVDSDMSSQYGRWLNFEIEAFEVEMELESSILNSLIDEVVDDIFVL